MRISIAWTARDVRATYALFVHELACFRLGGYRFYGPSTLDEIIATGDLFLESTDTPQLELMVRAVPDMPMIDVLAPLAGRGGSTHRGMRRRRAHASS